MRGKTYEDKLREVGLTTLEDRRDRGDTIQTFRIIHGIDQVERGTWLTWQVTMMAQHIEAAITLSIAANNRTVQPLVLVHHITSINYVT